MNNSFASEKRNTMCTKVNYSCTATQGIGTISSCIVEITQESATGYVDIFFDLSNLYPCVIINSLREFCKMEELRNFQSSPTRQKFLEDWNVILELSSRVQELQSKIM